MLSLLGAVILVTATTLIGYSKSVQLHTRVRVLAAVLTSLELLRGEICTMHTPIPELAARFAVSAPEETLEFFRRLDAGMDLLGERSFSEIWADAVNQSWKLQLSDEERGSLTLLGLSLGRYDTHEQESAITQCAALFERYLTEARATAGSQSKLYTGLGAAAGLTLAVLLY